MKLINCLVVLFLFYFSTVNFSASGYLIVGDDKDSNDRTDFWSNIEILEKKLDDSFSAADLETLKNILESNKHYLNKRGKGGMTLLHIAAIKGSLDVIKYLVAEQHVDIDQRSLYERSSALYEAVKAGQLESVKLLLELGANKCILFGFDNNSLLHQAALAGNIEVLKYLLPYFNVDVSNDIGETPANLAVRKDKLKAFRVLIDNGANPYKRDRFNRTLMHSAVRSGQEHVVREMIQYKELINAPDKYGNLPIDIVSNMQVVKELVDAGANITDKSIWNYLNTLNYDVVKYLVAERGKVNLRITRDGKDCRETLLMILLNMDTLPYDVIKFVLDRGADVNIKYCMNITALHRAAYYEKENTLQVIKLLLDKGADINAPDVDGYTPLDYSRGEGNQIVFKYLKEHGAVTKDGTSVMDSFDTTEDGESTHQTWVPLTEDDLLNFEFLFATTEYDESTLHSLVTTTEDDESTHQTWVTSTEDDESTLHSLVTTTEDDKSTLHSLFTTTEDDKLTLHSLVTTTEDDESTLHSSITTTENDK